jgi:hypothetical protein
VSVWFMICDSVAPGRAEVAITETVARESGWVEPSPSRNWWNSHLDVGEIVVALEPLRVREQPRVTVMVQVRYANRSCARLSTLRANP